MKDTTMKTKNEIFQLVKFDVSHDGVVMAYLETDNVCKVVGLGQTRQDAHMNAWVQFPVWSKGIRGQL